MLYAVRSPERDVVDGRVAGHVVERVRLAHVPCPPADDNRQLCLPVDLRCRIGRHNDRLAGTHQSSSWRLEKEIWTGILRPIHLHLAHVGVIVGARAKDLPRIAKRQLELRAPDLRGGGWIELPQRGLNLRPALDEFEGPGRRDGKLDNAIANERPGALLAAATAIRHEAPRFHFFAPTFLAGSLAPASKNSWPGIPGPHRLAKR